MNNRISGDTESENCRIDTIGFQLMSLLYQNLPYIESEDISKALEYVAENNEKALLKLIGRKESVDFL